MELNKIRFRFVLPMVVGFLSLVLMAWDYENNRIVESMGMGWDTGPPFWPYQAVYLFLFTVNVPAFVISMPVLKLLNLHANALSLQYAIWFPVLVGWWCWVGARLDFGVLGRRHYRHARLLAVFLSVGALVLLSVAAWTTLREIQWWMEYGRGDSPFRLPSLLTVVGPVLWCIVLATGCLVGAKRLFQGRFAPSTSKNDELQTILIGTLLVTLYIFLIHRWDKSLNPPFDYNVCEIDRLFGHGCFHGIVVGESGEPLDNVNVELTRASKTQVAKRVPTRIVATDKLGRYNFNNIEPGEYLVSVHEYLAPTIDRPFAAAYYPDVESESAAQHVEIKSSSRSVLNALRLKKLEFRTIGMSVVWSDGASPERSDVCFENLKNKNQELICADIDKGFGEMSLPVGSEHEAIAWVQCSVNGSIESRRSTSSQRVKLERDGTSPKLVFALEGARCTLWEKH